MVGSGPVLPDEKADTLRKKWKSMQYAMENSATWINAPVDRDQVCWTSVYKNY